MVCQSGEAQPLEVHGQEGNLGGDVNIPKVFIEFDAIDNAYLLMVEKIDVLGAQVTVAIPDASLLFTLRKPIGVVLGECGYRLLDLGVGLLGERLPNTVCGLPKVLLPIGEHLGQGAKAFGSRGEGVGLVKGRQKLCKCLYHLRCHGVTLKVGLQGAIGRQAVHFNRVFHHRAVTVKGIMLRVAVDGNHPEVDVGAQTAIQEKLLQAVESASFQGRIIQESQVDRLFDLVRPVVGQEHH